MWKIIRLLIRLKFKKENLDLDEQLTKGYIEYYKDYKSDSHEWDGFYKEWCEKHSKTQID